MRSTSPRRCGALGVASSFKNVSSTRDLRSPSRHRQAPSPRTAESLVRVTRSSSAAPGGRIARTQQRFPGSVDGNAAIVASRVLKLADRVALRRLAKNLPPTLASLVDRIGRLATGGRLWVGVAAALAAFSGRGRRAARAGVVSYVACSAITNGPVKWVSQRRRPRGLLLADLTRRGRPPRTSSLPSAHTANAAAFTVAASVELPAVAPVLTVVTGLVA